MSQPSARIARSFDAVNFFLADVRDGLGPYLAIYLLTVQKWDEATIGVVLSVAGVAGILSQTPVGALIDRIEAKRALVVAAAVAITAVSLLVPLAPQFWPVALLQALSGVAGSVFAPAIAAITLGVVGPKAFARRIGRNEAFNHAGNATAALIAAGAAYFVGPIAVFWLMAAMAVASVAAILRIPSSAIDHRLARGFASGEGDETPAEEAHASGFAALAENRPLLVFAAGAVMFHFANAAMLPLVGQKLALIVGGSYGTSLMAGCIVAAQAVMVPVALLVGAKADVWGRKPIFLTALGVLAVRGALYPLSDWPVWLVAVQLLDGIGAGIFGALFPLVVADVTRGAGRFNVAQGAIATAQGIGASLSLAVSGFVVATAGYDAAFLLLAAIAAAAFAIYLVAMPETAPRRAGRDPVAASEPLSSPP